MKILLLVPPFVEESLEMASKESIGVCYLAAVLRENGFDVEILDADLLKLDVEQTIARICQTEYAIIGFSVLEGTIESAEAIVNGLRKQNVTSHIVWGGYFPTLIPDEVLLKINGVDTIILGDGEYRLKELAQCIDTGKDFRTVKGLAYRERGQVIINEPGEPVALDQIPFPSRDLLPDVLQRGGITGIVGSRGCAYRCSFCCIHPYNNASGTKGWRGRTPSNIVDEMESVAKQWGVTFFSFYDSNFIGPGNSGIKRAYEIGEQIIARNLNIQFAVSTRPDQVDKDLFRFLKKAGLTEVFIGIENMSPKSLELYNKQVSVEQNRRSLEILEELELLFRPGFILYEPFIDLQQIQKNITYLKELMNYRFCNKFHFFKGLRVYRGSPLERIFSEKGIIIKNGWHAIYRWQDPAVEQFISLIGIVGSKMLPVVEQNNASEPNIRTYVDRLLGKWSLNAYEEILHLIQNETNFRDKFLDILIPAEKEMSRIQKLVDTWVQKKNLGTV